MEMDFKAWSEIILIGQQRYAAEWKSRFVCECTPPAALSSSQKSAVFATEQTVCYALTNRSWRDN